MKIAFLLPTINPERFINQFLPSLSAFKNNKESIVFCINFQPQWDEGTMQYATDYIRGLGFEVRHTFNEYPAPSRKGAIKFNKLRYDCAVLGRDADVFMLCDDDFVFCPDEGLDGMISEILALFKNNENAGVVQCRRKSGIPLSIRKLMLSGLERFNPDYIQHHIFYTDSGLFFRNVSKKHGYLVYPDDALELVGACEEMIIGFELCLKYGYDLYIKGDSAIYHKREGADCYSMAKENIVRGKDGTFTYIDERYKAEVTDKMNSIYKRA